MSPNRTFTATLPNGDTVTKKSTRAVTHCVGIIWPERGPRVFRWSAAPETAIKELQRKGWALNEIFSVPVR